MHLLQAECFVIYGQQRVLLYGPCLRLQLLSCLAACGGLRCTVELAVRTLDLAIERGECFGLLGPNGAGKSTSINMMVGLLQPSAGTALIGGKGRLRHAQ